jgi:hypothetical protein
MIYLLTTLKRPGPYHWNGRIIPDGWVYNPTVPEGKSIVLNIDGIKDGSSRRSDVQKGGLKPPS